MALARYGGNSGPAGSCWRTELAIYVLPGQGRSWCTSPVTARVEGNRHDVRGTPWQLWRPTMIAYISEREFQNTVRELAEAHGWTVFCTWQSKHSPAGEPDLRMVRPPRFIFAELKSERGRLTKEQEATLLLLQACPPIEVYLWRPADLDDIERILR